MATADDEISAAVEEIRERSEAVFDAHRRPDLLAAVKTAEDVPRLLAALDAVLKLHRPHRLYDECEHEHTEEEVQAGAAVDAGEFFTCEDSYMQTVCRHCCAFDGNGQGEDCAVNHLDECWPCPTVEAITRALAGEGETDGE